MQKKFSQLYCFVNEHNYLKLTNVNKNIHIIYRDYKKNIDICTLISIKKFCKKNNFKFYLSNNIKLALRCGLDGVYIPAFNKQINFKKYTVPKGFNIIGSAHNIRETLIKRMQGCKLVFLSPIFKVRKKKYYLNTIRFNLITLNIKMSFIALGGIKKKNMKKLKLLNIDGFAGISFFQKKTAPNRGR